MTTFAPGTNPDYANAYNNWFYGGGQKSGANQPRPSEFGRGTRSATGQQPNPAPAQPASGSAPVNMSAYGGGGYGQYAQPTRSAAQQAMPQFQQYGRQNDLSQPQGFNLWGAQGYAQGGQPGQSYTMPGYSQSFNGLTGQQIGQTQPSFDGNMAYQSPANRPAPVSWTTQGMDGQTYNGQQGFQQASQQRDAFMGGQGGLFERLGQYATNPQMGPPQFDVNAMLRSANESLTNTGFQNPFTSPMAQNPTPSFGQQAYDPRPNATNAPQAVIFPPAAPQTLAPSRSVRSPVRMSSTDARPVEPPNTGEEYNPESATSSLPPLPSRPSSYVMPNGQRYDPARQGNVPRDTPSRVQEKVADIDSEIYKWQRATYGTWQGSGPPQAWSDHINNLKRLRQRALAGDPAALAWSPKMQAPPPRQHAVVPVGERGNASQRSNFSQRRNAR